MKVVIVGNGIAGSEAAFHLRDLRPDAEITLLSIETGPAYDPCTLPYVLSRELPRHVAFFRAAKEYQRARITLMPGYRATGIDVASRVVHTVDDTNLPYDRLILAPGGRPITPPIKGLDLPGVFPCKTLCDVDRLARHEGRRVVVIGSGAVGIEAAEALRKRNYEVVILELLDWILPAMLDEDAARLLQDALRRHDVIALTNTRARGILGRGRVEAVCTDCEEIPCDTVVLAAGVTPDRGLAEDAGIRVGRGILVNSRMETSVPGIFACGDCAEPHDALTGERCLYALKPNAIDQARVAARAVAGLPTSYRGAFAFARAHFFDTHAASFGLTSKTLPPQVEAEIQERREGGSYLRVLLLEGRIIGAHGVGSLIKDLGSLMASALRQDDIQELVREWAQVCSIKSAWPWTHRQLGRALGLRLPLD